MKSWHEQKRLAHLRSPNTVLQEIRQSTKARTHALTIRMVSEWDPEAKGGRGDYRQKAEILEAVPRHRGNGGGSPMQVLRQQRDQEDHS